MARYGVKRNKNRDIPIADMSLIFEYAPEGGLMTKVDRPNSPKGSRVGRMVNGYMAFNYCGFGYYVHRVVWALCNNTQPNEIDHINGDKGDNRIENLRSVSRSQNARSYFETIGSV